MAAILVILVAGSVLAIGTVHTETLLGIALIALGGTAVALLRERWVPIPAAGFALLLSIYMLLQSLPLPLPALRVLSPHTADIWERALAPFGESLSWGSLSIDPGASRVEALKWLTYASVFGIAASVTRQRGLPFVAKLVFASALALALSTLAHGLFEARDVYGLYTPSFTPSRWSSSPLLNPNNLASYLNLGAFAGLGLLVSSERSRSRLPYALGIATLVGQTVLTGSRGGVLALLLGLVAASLLAPRLNRSKAHRARPFWSWQGASALGLGLTLALLGARQVTWDELLQEGTEKLSIVRWALPLIQDHPLWGVGAGGFETAFPAYRTAGGPSIWRHPENFVVAWLSEWGVPVGLGASIGLVWLFRPKQTGARESRLAACLWIGSGVLCLQNLVDLGLSLPSVSLGLAAALGGLWGAHHDRVERNRAGALELAPLARSRAGRLVPRLLLGGIILGVPWVLATGLRDAHTDRTLLAQAYQRTDFGSEESREAFRRELRKAMLRHPGESFFPRLGALAALRTPDERPLVWINRALERDRNSARLHLLLAEILIAEGARSQALLAFRLAAEREPTLARTLARRALAWTQDPDELVGIVPEGERGAPLLVALVEGLVSRKSSQAPLRRRLLDEAARRDPEHPGVHSARARELLLELAREEGDCTRPCQLRLEQHIEAVRRTDPHGATQLDAERLAVLGRQAQAVTLLLEKCPREATGCLKYALELSAQTPDLPLDNPSQAYLAASCHSPSSCGKAHRWVGSLYAQRRLWSSAFAHYARAAELSHDLESWLFVADTAHQEGVPHLALEALRRAESLAGGDNARQKRIEDRRRAILGAPRHDPRLEP